MQHWSCCSLYSLPARFPMPCDCGGYAKERKPPERLFCPSDYTLALRLQNYFQLWKYRWLWKRDNHASLHHFFLIFAKHSRLGRWWSRNLKDAVRTCA